MNRDQAKQAILAVMSEYADDTLMDAKFVDGYLDNAILIYGDMPPNLYSNFAAYLNAFRMECKERKILSESQSDSILAIMDLFLNKSYIFR